MLARVNQIIKMMACCLVGLSLPAGAVDDSTSHDIAFLSPGENGFWQVWIMDQAGQHSRQITRSSYDKNNISWFPEGKYLLVNGSQGELNRVGLVSGQEKTLPMPLQGFIDATLSPNGKTVVFSLSTSNSVDDNNLWHLPLDGSKQTKITNMRHMQHEPSWSDDGETVYFLSGDGGEAHDIWSLDIKSGSKQQLTFNGLYNFDVKAAPDGRLVFSSNRSGNYDIWLRDVDGKLTQLTHDSALDAGPAWSPSGKEIIFQSARDGYHNLWKLHLGSGKLTQLTHSARGIRKPLWRRQKTTDAVKVK